MLVEQGAEVNFQPVIVKQCSLMMPEHQLPSNRPDEPIDFLLCRIKVPWLVLSPTGNESRSHLDSCSCNNLWPETCCGHYDIVFSADVDCSYFTESSISLCVGLDWDMVEENHPRSTSLSSPKWNDDAASRLASFKGNCRGQREAAVSRYIDTVEGTTGATKAKVGAVLPSICHIRVQYASYAE